MMRRLLMLFVRAWQVLMGSWIGPSCRYEPTCSSYAMQALERHGALAGSYLAAARILRCNPFCLGGCDAVPDQAPALFTRFTRKASSFEPKVSP